jgi:hypothetical protein
MAEVAGNTFFAKRKFWAVAGQVHVWDTQDNLICYVKAKIFKLREDITVYSDEKMTQPLLLCD